MNNTVYFSQHLTAYKCWSELAAALARQQVDYALLPNTKDIWMRDFMPVQCAPERYVAYRYEPDYLRGQSQYITNWKHAFAPSRIPYVNSGLILDGGNVIMCGSKVIMTEKVFQENPSLLPMQLIHRLDKAFQAETVIIPWDRNEPYGHADGMVRYIGDGKVLLTNYCDFDTDLRKKLLDALQPHFEVVELHYDIEKPHKWNWAYINFLLADRKLFLPRLNTPEDEQACAQIGTAFGIPREHIELVDITGVMRNGGGLNCISWNGMQEIRQLRLITSEIGKAENDMPAVKHRKLISPMMEDAFTPEVLKMVIENDLGHELQPNIWKAFDDAFTDYWDKELGVGTWFYYDQMAPFIHEKMKEKRILVSYEYIEKMCKIVLDFIEQIPGVILH